MTKTKNEKITRKGQMEIIGLVVIVMIVTVALLFVLFFFTRGDSDDSVRNFDDNLHSYNTISAVIQANSPCRGLTITDLLQECVAFDRPMPPECSPLGNQGHCAYAEGQIFIALNRSLSYVNEEYRFYVYTEGDPNNYKIDIGSDNSERACLDGEKVSATQPIRYAGGNLFVTLDICT